jgi:hypothetical protein
MTPSERKQVAAVPREWAKWCEANPAYGWVGAYFRCKDSAAAFDAQFPAQAFCWPAYGRGDHRGTVAATGLLLAAAAVESGVEI